ncbi:MAG: hypothetical protein ACXVPU_08655 [Bacteroidia bacterium]
MYFSLFISNSDFPIIESISGYKSIKNPQVIMFAQKVISFLSKEIAFFRKETSFKKKGFAYALKDVTFAAKAFPFLLTHSFLFQDSHCYSPVFVLQYLIKNDIFGSINNSPSYGDYLPILGEIVAIGWRVYTS